MTRRIGRPHKLTPEIQERLIEALRAGNYIETACQYAGLHKTTYYQYQALADEPDPPAWAVDFANAVKEARAQAEVRNLTLIQKAAKDAKHWTAAAWFLERSYPNRWGRVTRVQQEISGPNQGPIEIADARATLLKIIEDTAHVESEGDAGESAS